MLRPHQRAAIERIGGAGGLGAGARDVVAAGLLALEGDCALIRPICELQELADRLARIQGRRLPSGALWAPTPAALPDPTTINGPELVVTPTAVMVLAVGGALIVDVTELVVTIQEGADLQHSAEIELADLPTLTALLPAALGGLARSGPGRRDLHVAGLEVERLASGSCRLTAGGVAIELPHVLCWSLAAEIASLAARTLTSSAATRQLLERQLQEVGDGY